MHSPKKLQIIDPAPGHPTFLHSREPTIEVTVIHAMASNEELSQWARDLCLIDIRSAERFPLEVADVISIGKSSSASEAFFCTDPAVGWEAPLAKIRLNSQMRRAFSTSSRPQLFHLANSENILQTRCVTMLKDDLSELRIAFASDLHYAAIWDVISEAISTFAPELHEFYRNPNQLIDSLVDEANSLHASGELDLLILGGDLVDHVYFESLSSNYPSPSETNYHRFIHRIFPAAGSDHIDPRQPRLPPQSMATGGLSL